MILVDTSVWIQVFRKREPLEITTELSLEDVVTCLPVVQEVLQGFREERAYRIAREAMNSFPIVDSPLPAATVEEAVNLFRAARKNGLTVRSSVDCLIAASAIRNGLTVLHVDRDFDFLARVSNLQVRRVHLKARGS